MASYLAALTEARDRRYVPPIKQDSLYELANKLNLVGGISLLSVIAKLGTLLPLTRVIETGQLNALGAHATSTLVINSLGDWQFSGHAWESQIVGHNYSIGIALIDVRDEDNNVPTVEQHGTVHGHLAIGSSEEDWTQQNNSPALAKQWDVVRRGRVHWVLTAKTNGWDLGQALFVGVVALLGGAAFGSLASDPDAQGGWETDDRGNKSWVIRW
jgi:hypothetical protein